MEIETSTSTSLVASDPGWDLEDVKLADIVKTLPAECFEKKPWKALSLALINVLLVGLGYWGLAVSPGYLLPFLWIFTGTSLAGLFMVAHDCGHHSFAKRHWVNDLIGHLLLTPLLYPFYNWRIQHNRHHNLTNKLGREGWRQLHDIVNSTVDPYWHPVRSENYASLRPHNRWIYEMVRGHFWWLATVENWWSQIVINVSKLPEQNRPKVRFSRAVVITFAAIALPTLILTTGIWGLIKFWLVPWLLYHFWFSTITLIHHTSQGTVWKSGSEWNAAQAQLNGTVHCNYPRWVEFLLHDINYHVPHHIAPGIPAYNLRMAHQSLKQNWGKYIRECNFSWSLIQEITSQCHLYSYAEERYQSFDEAKRKLSASVSS